MVHDTDIVELELRSKRFSLAVRKKEAIEALEPQVVYQVCWQPIHCFLDHRRSIKFMTRWDRICIHLQVVFHTSCFIGHWPPFKSACFCLADNFMSEGTRMRFIRPAAWEHCLLPHVFKSAIALRWPMGFSPELHTEQSSAFCAASATPAGRPAVLSPAVCAPSAAHAAGAPCQRPSNALIFLQWQPASSSCPGRRRGMLLSAHDGLPCPVRSFIRCTWCQWLQRANSMQLWLSYRASCDS